MPPANRRRKLATSPGYHTLLNSSPAWVKMPSVSASILFLRGGGFGLGDLFGVGNKGVEARVAVEGLEIVVLFHAQLAGGRQPVVNCSSQERQRLCAIPPLRRDTSK